MGLSLLYKDGLVCSQWTNNDYPATVTPFALEETVTTLYDWIMASQYYAAINVKPHPTQYGDSGDLVGI